TVCNTSPIYVLTFAHCCDWLSHYNDLRNSTLVLIDSLVSTDMGQISTTTTTRLPFRGTLYKKMYGRENSQLRFIRDSLEQIYNLYRHGDMSAAGWDDGKTTNFLESINRQIVELNECVSALQLELRLTGVLTRVLLLQGGRDGWEMLRRATEQNLIQLEQLGNRIKANRGQH
uniref:Uncharacterized protein n=1 Tax=Xiphophorus couchianus TaxID=32473 RepID=A0A3B5MWZ1_9TELE